MLWHLILVALLSVEFARALCRWPVPLPSGYLINCNTAEPLALEEVPNCTVSCEGPWHFGAANLSCSDGGLQLSGCLVPSAAQSGALVNLGTAPGSRLGGLAVDIWRGRLVATDEAQHVVLALGMDGSVEVIWGQLGVRGDADGTATGGALLAEPLGLVQTQKLLFVADTGNGKVRVLALDTGVTVTAASGFSEPKGLALSSSELLVADSGAVLRLPLASALDAGTWSSAAVQASSLSSVSGVTGQPSWLGFRDSTGELFVSESSGSVQRLLNGARTELLQSGPFDLSDALPRSSGFLPAPGPLAVDETVETSMLLVADSQALFGLELRTSDRSCSDLGWDSSHGNIAVCGRSAGSDVLGARCNYTFVDGVCCSGALNLTDAERFCTLQGARLCTQEELFDDEARDDPFSPHCLTGASVAYDGPYDQANVWSSTACFVEGTGAVGFMTRAGSRRWRNWAVDRCQTAEETAVVKCCADRGFLVPMAGLGGLDTSHGLFQDFESNITAIAMDSARRLAFLGLEDGSFAMLALGAPRFAVAGLAGEIGQPAGLAFDAHSGRLLVADRSNHVLRSLDLLKGGIDIVAGTDGLGVDAGDGGSAGAAAFFRPNGVALDASADSAAVFVTTGSQRLRELELGGGITSAVNVAGIKGLRGDHGPGTDAELNEPQNVCVKGDKVYIADRNNHRVRVLDRSTGKITSAAGPVLFSTSGSSVQAEYSAYPDPNMTSAHLPKDLVTTTPVGLVVSSDASFAVISDEHSESLLHLDRSVVPRRVRVIQGTSAIRNPKDLLLAENGTLFVADHSSHGVFALEFVCDADADFYTGGCRVLAPPRRILGVSYVPGTPVVPGDGDSERRQPSTVTSTTSVTFTSTFTTTQSELPCWNHLLGKPGEDCHAACARHEGTCDSDVAGGFDFEAFQRSVVDSERVTCVRDSRSWWSDAMPGFESNRESRNFPGCLGTYNMPAEIPCDGVFMEYGQASTTMRRWCKCRRESMCYMTTTTTVPPAYVPTTTVTHTWTGPSTTVTSVTSTSVTVTVTRTTFQPTTSPSPYRQDCPPGYDPLPSPLPLAPDPSGQNSARACAVLCEVSSGCVAFVFDASVGLCKMHRAGSAGFPVSTEQGSEHYTSCERDTSNLDLLLDLLLADWMPADAALNLPGAMAMDNARQLLYFCDTGNHKIKVLDISRNEVLTVAGIGASVSKFSGDGQPARDAVMATPAGLALDEENGHLYLSDHENHVIRRVKLGENRLTGIIESVAGTGVGGLAQDGLAPLLSRFNYPRGLALEKLSTGVRIYVADSRNHQVAVVDLTSPQMVRKIAGRLEAGVVPTEVGDKGPALEAQVYQPEAIAFANGELFFAEPRMDRLRQMDLSSGVIDTALSTYAVNFSAGEGLAGVIALDYDAGLALPLGVAVLGDTLLTASYGTGQVRQTNLTSGITTDMAGRRNLGYFTASPGAGDGSRALDAILAGPVAVIAHEERQVVYIAESDTGRIRQVNLSTGIIATLPPSVPLPGSQPELFSMALDTLNHLLYVSSPSDQVVYGLRLDAQPCLAPWVANAAAPACAEGEEVQIDHCTPVCATGYEPDLESLHCAHGILTPPSFSCREAPCLVPWGIEHAELPPCEEGMKVASGDLCTARCMSGYYADTNLTCEKGVFQPSTFQCLSPTTVTVTAAQAVADNSSATTAAPANSEVDAAGSAAEADSELWVEDLFGGMVVYDPSTAVRSEVPLEGSFSFEALTSGLTFAEVSLLAQGSGLRRPLSLALIQTLKLLPEDLELLALTATLPSGGRRLASLSHRFSLAFAVPRPPLWVPKMAEALRHSTGPARQAWASSLQTVLFVEAMADVAANRDRPCPLPTAPTDAPLVMCEEAQRLTPSGGICSTRCLEPLVPSEAQLHCFAGFWSPASFVCQATAAQDSCPVPAGVAHAADPPCQEAEAGSVQRGQVCTPRCSSGWVPTEAVLACGSSLQPSTFACVKPDCRAPAVANASEPSCLEGHWVTSGRQCTARCLPGFVASVTFLSCSLGTLAPPRFLCTNASIVDTGDADNVWGSLNTRPATASTTQASSSNSTTAANEVQSEETVLLNLVTSETFVLAAASTGGACGLFLVCCVFLRLLRRRRRQSNHVREAAAGWESAIEEIRPAMDSPRRSPRRRKKSGVTSGETSEAGEEAKGELFEIDGLEGPEEVKEILRLVAGKDAKPEEVQDGGEQTPREEEHEDPEWKGEQQANMLEDADFQDLPPQPEPELLLLAIEAANEAEAPRPRSKDAVFEAMDRELGEACDSAREVPPLSRSAVAQQPKKHR